MQRDTETEGTTGRDKQRERGRKRKGEIRVWHIVVRKSATYLNSFQQLQNFVESWSSVDYLISEWGKAEEGSWYGGIKKGKKSLGCACTSRRRAVRSLACRGPVPATNSDPSSRARTGAPQCPLLCARRRRGSAGTRVCALACTHGILY